MADVCRGATRAVGPNGRGQPGQRLSLVGTLPSRGLARGWRAAVHAAASPIGKVLRRPRTPQPPVMRYECAQPGELPHLDTKKLDRF